MTKRKTLGDHQELLKDWDFELNVSTNPFEIALQSNKTVNWKCHVCGYKWKTTVAHRSNGRGCPCCSNKVVVPGVNDLATTHPYLAKEWHPYKNGSTTPKDVT